MHTAEPFVQEPRLSEVENAIGKLKCYKPPGVDSIPAKLVHAGGSTLHSETHKLLVPIWNQEVIPQQREDSVVELPR